MSKSLGSKILLWGMTFAIGLSACEDTELLSYNPVRNEMDKEVETPDNPQGFKDYQLLFEDEFDGDKLNENVWKYRLDERLGGYNLAENVSVKDGRLVQQMAYKTVNGKKSLTSGGVISQNLFGYGYYETKCKLFSGTGAMHSSFWSMGQGGGDGVNMPRNNTVFEIDGYEVDSHTPKKLTCNLNSYIGVQTGLGGVVSENFPTDEEFVLGYEWLPTEVNWYVNGEKVQTRTNKDFAFSYAQQNVWITALGNGTMEYLVDESKLPGSSSWDYFRFYAVLLKGINLIGNGEFEYNQNESYASVTIRDPQYPIAWSERGNDKASFVEYNDNAISGRNVLKHHYASKYKVTTAQRLQYIANGTYDLEAYVMSSGGQAKSVIRVSNFKGGEVKEVNIPATDRMTKVEIKGVDVLKNGALIEIVSDADAGQWMLVDNIKFYATEGCDGVDEAPAFSQSVKDKVYGETVTAKPSSKNGDWQGGIAGYDKNSSLFSYNRDGKSWAEFTLTAGEDDFYKIRFFKVVSEGTGTSEAKVVTTYGNKRVEQTWNLYQGPKGWVTLAQADLKKGDRVTVRMSGKGLLRVSALALTPEELFLPAQVLIMAVDKPRAVAFGEYVMVNSVGDEVLPENKNGVIHLPVKLIEQQFKISLDCTEASIALENLKTKLPSNLKVTHVPSKKGKDHVVIGPKAYKVTDKLDNILFSIL